MEEINNSMGQTHTAFSSSSVELDATITASVPDIQAEVVLEESKETNTNDSVICLDDEDDCALPDLPGIFPSGDKTLKNDKSSDDDFSIVYEKVVSKPDIQIVLTDQTEKFLMKTQSKRSERKKQKVQTNSDGSSDQNGNIGVINENETQDFSPDDSVSIIDDECSTSHLTKTKYNALRQSLLDSAEKKKRKIECAVCFDGPDEISKTGRNLVSTLCGHIFCDNCIKESMKVYKRCPQCRKKLTAKQYHPIYL